MDMENCEFREALQILGNITGKEIPGYTENKEKLQLLNSNTIKDNLTYSEILGIKEDSKQILIFSEN